ncbi:MAG: aldehyde reductase [Pseudomonadota bacterium]
MTKVFLTGASGFIAKHILRELIEKGYAVRASVRSETRRAELQDLFPDAQIEFALLDLTSDDGWAEAMSGCDVLIHTASPFPMGEPKDPQSLIRPAVDGTIRAMRAAKDAGIKRVILTSSNAAIYKDASKPKDAPSDESNWTTPDADFVSAYEASKTLAERAAWDFVKDNPEVVLTTINPGLVLGPSMGGRFGTSLEIVERVMSGKDPFAPPLEIQAVDVRDVAMMHVKAIDLDAAKGERFSAAAGMVSFLDMANDLREWDPSLKTAKKVAPTWLLRVLAVFMPEMKVVLHGLGRNLSVPGDKAEAAFGFKFIAPKEALIASAGSVKQYQT